MADKPDEVNWGDKACNLGENLLSQERSHLGMHHAIDKLTDCNCVELHDRWSDLETAASSDRASKTASKSLGPYEDNQFAASAKLNKYIKQNLTPTSSLIAPTADSGATASTGAVPKLTTCKLLFPKELTKASTPSKFRLWVAAFRRFHDTSNIKQQSVATLQGYLLRVFDAELQEVVKRKLTPSMQLFGPAGCLDILDGEFQTLSPIFNRRVDFFQVEREQGENTVDLLHRLTKLADIGDLESMSKEELTTFRFISACNDQCLRDKIFNLKRKDATAIRDTVAQYELQQKAKAALRSKASPVATVKQPAGEESKCSGLPSELAGRCASCGNTSHLTQNCSIKKKGILCNHCGKPGHLAKVCLSPLQGKPKMQSEAKPKPIRAVTDLEAQPQDSWVNRLNLKVSHSNGSFTLRTFPDTGSAATLIAADLAKKNNVQPTKPSLTKYVNVCGDPVTTKGTAPITLSTSNRSTSTRAVITPAINNEINIGRDDLKDLGIIPKQFPAPVFIVSENRFSDMRDSLIKNNPDVLTDDLPKGSMDTGCVSMRIQLTPGEKMPFRISTARQIPLHWREKAERIVK